MTSASKPVQRKAASGIPYPIILDPNTLGSGVTPQLNHVVVRKIPLVSGKLVVRSVVQDKGVVAGTFQVSESQH